MRPVLLLAALVLLTRCSGISQSQEVDNQSPTSLMGSQGGGGIETSIWSDNPDQKTWFNEHPAYSGD